MKEGEYPFDILAFCEICHEKKPCAMIGNKMMCIECYNQMKEKEGRIAYN